MGLLFSTHAAEEQAGKESELAPQANNNAASISTNNANGEQRNVLVDRCFSEKFLNTIEEPLKIAKDKLHKKNYFLCTINCEGQAYRSPWSNLYEPNVSNGYKPCKVLRQLEVDANVAFEQYAFYIGGIQSVFVRQLEEGYAVAALIKKKFDLKTEFFWEAAHVFEVFDCEALCKRTLILTSKVMLWSQVTAASSVGDGNENRMKLVGRLVNQMTLEETRTHVTPNVNVFVRMVDEMEDIMRSNLNDSMLGQN